ncbi:MAG: hypothetical protein MUC50_23060, partial [Myxococcota bacterium]|nr:hypothetical protein [Myxococcota bacterium]
LGRVLTHQPVHVSQYRQDVDPQIDRVLQKALEKAPKKRYQTAQELAADLRKVSPLEEQEAATVLQQLIFEDFNDEMASVLGVESLQQREKAWRHPSKAPAGREESVTRELRPAERKQLAGVQGDFPHEREGDAISQVAQIQKTGVSKGVWLGALVLAVVVVAVGVTIALSRRVPQPETKILIVQSPVVDPSPANDVESGKAEKESEKQKPLDTSGAQASKEAAPEPVGNAVGAGRENGDNPPGRRASKEVSKLTRAFKKQEGKIRQCFESHALELKGAPEITFRFEIAPDGRVQSASLSPASLASTPLGKCLTRVAVNTPFPALSKSASFTIPVKARRGGEH